MRSTGNSKQQLGGILRVLLLVAFTCPAAAAVERGPYLQLVTTHSAVIRWHTTQPTAGIVKYGDSADRLSSSSVDAAPITSHSLTLIGLKPDTQYFYNISDLPSAKEPWQFQTLPLPVRGNTVGSPQSGTVRAWVLGDCGSGYPGQAAVRDAYTSYTDGRPTNAVLLLGDNAYNRGTYEEYTQKFFGMLTAPLAQSCVYAGMGDHDLYSANSLTQSGVYYDLFDCPAKGEAGGVPSGTEAYYSFDCGAVHFIALESMMDLSPASPQIQWLRKDLAAAADAPWIVAYFHWAPYSMGSYNTDKAANMTGVRQKLVPVLEEGGVDLVMAGHSHTYERSCLLAGHYGTSDQLTTGMQLDSGNGPYQKSSKRSPRDGTIYVVLGCSGIPKPRVGHHPIMRHEYDGFGSGVIEADASRLDFSFLTDTGKVNDWFAIARRQ